MADIEVLIKIPEEVYKQFRKDQKEKYVSAMISTDIIANGIPLPKRHGRLIDADALNRKDVNCANVPMNFINTAKTIIEADKESEDEDKE